MYAASATPDDFDGPPLVSAETMREATRIRRPATVGPARRSAATLPVMFNMRWRLGYHMIGTTSGVLPRAFGHFGFGGSGAGDPESGLAVAMILNQVGGTPFGDTKMLRIGGAAVRSAKSPVPQGSDPQCDAWASADLVSHSGMEPAQNLSVFLAQPSLGWRSPARNYWPGTIGRGYRPAAGSMRSRPGSPRRLGLLRSVR